MTDNYNIAPTKNESKDSSTSSIMDTKNNDNLPHNVTNVPTRRSSFVNPSASRQSNIKLTLDYSTLSKSLDPRARRLARLLASKVLDLHEEKVSQLHIMPSTPYDQYHRVLRGSNPVLKQTGITTGEESR